MKPRVLFVLTRSPYPAVDGTRERILEELKALNNDFQINLLIISDEKIEPAAKKYLQEIISGEIFIFKLKKLGCYGRSLINLFSSQPLQSAYFYHQSAIGWLKKRAADYQVINFHTLRFGPYLKYLKKETVCQNSRLLLSFNDALSLNYAAAAKKARGLWRLIYLIEAKRIKNYELEMLATADNFSIISERDKKYLQTNWQKKYPEKQAPNINVIYNGLKDEIFNYNYQPQTNNLVFIGNLLYPPNRQGLAFFYRNIWPEILAAKPETKFLIIGRGGQEYFKNENNLEVLGFIDNPYSLLTQQALFISPADFGAGVPTKSLLAMALGIPVVSTINNAAGIEGIIADENICLIDYQKSRQAADKIIKVLEDKEYRRRIGRAGQELISQKYRQSNNYPRLKSFLNS